MSVCMGLRTKYTDSLIALSFHWICFFVLSYRQLTAHLKVFAKFTNPRALYLESSLSELYNQVNLKHPSDTTLENILPLRVERF